MHTEDGGLMRLALPFLATVAFWGLTCAFAWSAL